MSRPKRQRELQALAAQRREFDLRKAEEKKKVADYFELYTNKSRHHENWTTEDYYEKSKKEADSLSEMKIKAVKLEERQKKLERMLFQENLQFQQELKALASRPKYYKNGSYLNEVPTSTLRDVNQGIKDKEEALRKQEAELRLHHAWRISQPELRAASSYIANGKMKSTWMEQIIQKEQAKKREEEETRKTLQERDEMLRKQIEIEQDRLKEKDLKMRELRVCLETQIAELSKKENEVKELRKQEERARLILSELQSLTKERERECERLVSERDTSVVNMGLHKYSLKRKVLCVLKEIQFDMEMLERVRRAVIKESETAVEKAAKHARVLEEARRELEQCRERERQRQSNIEAMYDGEARQIHSKQDLLWAKEREARQALMSEVLATLQRQVEERVEMNRQLQRANVLEREKIIEAMDQFHKEVRAKEMETKLQSSKYSTITSLQSELNNLNLQRQKLEDTISHEAGIKAQLEHEREIRKEIAALQRRGEGDIQNLRRDAWA